MEQFDYSEMVYGFLSLSRKNSDFGPCVRSYRIDYRHDAFYFFAKYPEEVLDVEVFSILGGEMHQADSTSFTPRRFLYVEKKESAAELNAPPHQSPLPTPNPFQLSYALRRACRAKFRPHCRCCAK